MSDPLRTETSRAPEPTSRAEREAKIEQLLLAGLDHYFAARYDQAIDVWTRALFLDRSHPRARAYIERARSALAERQRESEALLHDGAAAVRRGDGSEARRLLDEAMARGDASDEVLALLERVERLEQTSGADSIAIDEELTEPRLILEVEDPSPARRSRAAWLMLATFVAVILAAAGFAARAMQAEWGPLVDRALSRRADRPAPVSPTVLREPAPPIPRRAEVSLARARALLAGGKLRDALPLLESIRITEPERAEADRLRGEIQRQLIALGPLPAPQTAARGGSQP
jgi:tetratricopeptide (TPR) repeat protein